MSDERKMAILARLKESDSPVSASVLAKELGVTRQVIVGDVALLRASGSSVIATPRGYLFDRRETARYVVTSTHEHDRLLEELCLILDCGCGIVDVMVEHTVYGKICCDLHIFTKEEARVFVEKLEEEKALPLSVITNSNTHLHTLQCPSEKHFLQAKELLKSKGF